MISTEIVQSVENGRIITNKGVRRAAGNALIRVGSAVTVMGDMVIGWRRRAGYVPGATQLPEGILFLEGTFLALRSLGSSEAKTIIWNAPGEGYDAWFCVEKDLDYYILWVGRTLADGTATAIMEHNEQYEPFTFNTRFSGPWTGVDAKIENGDVVWVVSQVNVFLTADGVGSEIVTNDCVAVFDYYNGTQKTATVDRSGAIIQAALDGECSPDSFLAKAHAVEATASSAVTSTECELDTDYTYYMPSGIPWWVPQHIETEYWLPIGLKTYGYFSLVNKEWVPETFDSRKRDGMTWLAYSSSYNLWTADVYLEVIYSNDLYMLTRKNDILAGKICWMGPSVIGAYSAEFRFKIGDTVQAFSEQESWRRNDAYFDLHSETARRVLESEYAVGVNTTHITLINSRYLVNFPTGGTPLKLANPWSRTFSVGPATATEWTVPIPWGLNKYYTISVGGRTFNVNTDLDEPIFGADNNGRAWAVAWGEYELYDSSTGQTTTGETSPSESNRVAYPYTGELLKRF